MRICYEILEMKEKLQWNINYSKCIWFATYVNNTYRKSPSLIGMVLFVPS